MKIRKKKVKRVAQIPTDLKVGLVKKFRSKDRTKRFVVVSRGESFQIHAVAKGKGSLVRSIDLPKKTEVPIPVLRAAHRDLAVFMAGHLSRTNAFPSERRERIRRRRFIKKAMLSFQAHTETRTVVQQLKGTAPKPVVKPKPRAKMPWVFLYDPKQSLGDTTFRIHSAYCTRLDGERKKVVLKKGGASWVVEAEKATDAIRDQIAEFDLDQKGYEPMDFTIHNCSGAAVRVTGKTSMGVVGRVKGRK